MVSSMTAFARSEQETNYGVMSWELRSVNHRYLEMSVRLPEEMRSMEARIRERIASRLGRGKVDCFFRYRPNAAAGMHLNLNEDLVIELVNVLQRIDTLSAQPTTCSSIDILRWPGVVQLTESNKDQVQVEALTSLDEVLDELCSTRQREGARLCQVILQRCDGMHQLMVEARQRLPQIMEQFRNKLVSRLNELKEQIDAQRLEQEIALMAHKMDVAEELDRIDVHIDEVRRVMEQDGPVGRRLDFLMQELNREVNTLGSKSLDVESTRLSVEMKVFIEQMREQIQNIE